MHKHNTILAAVAITLLLGAPVQADGTAPKEYIANGIETIWCDGTTGTGDHEDDPLVEPWCVPLNALNPGEETEIGGVEWDLATSDRGRGVIYSTNDALGVDSFSVLGIKGHFGDFLEPVSGCGGLMYMVPDDAPLDSDGDIDLIGQISIVHATDDLNVCLGSTGEANILLFG